MSPEEVIRVETFSNGPEVLYVLCVGAQGSPDEYMLAFGENREGCYNFAARLRRLLADKA